MTACEYLRTLPREQRVKVLTILCAEYHSGQWSRGYRFLSLLQRRIRRLRYPCPLEGEPRGNVAKAYHLLAAEYGEEL